MIKRLGIIASALVLSASIAHAQAFPERSHLRVNDYANLLDSEAEARITRQLDDIARDLGTDMTVLTIRSRTDHGDHPDIESFATALFNSWGIGSIENNSGILILVARQDRDMRVELGADYPPIYNEISENVIDGAFLPAFRKDDYQNGIETGVSRTIDRIAGPFARGEEVRAEPDRKRIGGLIALLAVGSMGVSALIATAVYRRRRKCPQCGQQSLNRSKTTIVSATRSRFGQGRRDAKCDNCDYTSTSNYTIPMISTSSSSLSSGGSSSSSGGSSSGGGGSGSW